MLLQPFIAVAVWSIVIAVALSPPYERLAGWLGGRRRLAAAMMTIAFLVVIIGPATWLALGLIDSLRAVSTEFDLSTLTLPAPPPSIKGWPLIGQPIYQFWDLASTNLRGAVAKIAPYLQPVGTMLLGVTAEAGTGMLKFFAAIFVAGFLFAPAPRLVETVRTFARRLLSERGEEFVALAGATIRAVSRGVIGISVLQAVIGGIGMSFAGVPGASLLTLAILVLGIIQIGPLLIVAPVVVWSWTTLATGPALALTACMATVSVIDNFLKPFVLTSGATPRLVTFIGVVGGVLAYGFAGLFVGPVVLAVAWDLANAWISNRDKSAG
jgi:predicted PurR-regulated permease PerM